ncbi:MAG: substrate-binding domain-containing protein [Lachnospirales bacterium]
MKKRILASTIATLLMVGTLSGCGSKPSESAEPTNEGTQVEESGETDSETSGEETGSGDYTFEVIVKSYQSSYWQAAVKGIDAKAEELGVKVNTTGPNAESDIADQVNMLNNAINNNPDGIGLAACDQDSVLDSLQVAMDKQIPVVCFDAGVPNAPEGSVYSTIATDNYAAGATAAEHIYEAVKDKIANATEPVRIGEVNQDATSESIISRGLGFIDKIIELAEADGKTVAVVGNDYYKNNCSNAGDEATANVIIDVAVPAQTTVELCATEASNILNKADTIAIFGSNQVSAEGLLTANQNLSVLGSDPETNIIAAGFDAGATIKAAVTDRTLFGAVTQSPLKMGETTVEVLTAIANGETVEDVKTDGYWYDDTNIADPSIAPNLYD